MALTHPLGEHLGHLLADDDDLGVGPFGDVGIGEEADLFVHRHHVEAFAHHLANRVGEEVVPPESGEAEVRQFAAHRAERLVGVPAGDKALEAKSGMAADDLGQLTQGALGNAAGGFEGEGFGAEAELEDDLASAFFQRGEPILRIVQRLINEQPAPVAESQLSPIVRRMLRKDPAERYPSLHELLHELRELPTDPQALIRAKITREPTLSLPPIDPILTLPTDEQPTRLQDDLRPVRRSPAPSELSPAAFEQAPLLRRALWPTATVLCVIGLGAVLLQRLPHRSPTPPIVTAQPVVPQPAPMEPLPPVQLAPQEKTVPQAKPAQAKPLLTVKPRAAQKLQRAFVITGATPSQEQLVRLCADKALGELPGLYSTTIRLERSGALHLTQAPDVVYRSGFDACLRQAFHATTTPLPETVTVRVLIQRPKL